MGTANDDEQKQIGTGSYILAAASFIPLVGVPFGLVSIVLGWLRRSSGGLRLVAIGAAGIGLSVVLYGSLFVAQKTGLFEGGTSQLTQGLLDDSVRSIEFYRLKHGKYPDSLEAVRPENPFIDDPFAGLQSLFRYSVHNGGESYEIFSIGPDRRPSTNDDLRPSPETVQGTGYAPK